MRKPTLTQALLLAAIVLLALNAWNTRYVTTRLRGGLMVVHYDQWTGKRTLCTATGHTCRPFGPK